MNTWMLLLKTGLSCKLYLREKYFLFCFSCMFLRVKEMGRRRNRTKCHHMLKKDDYNPAFNPKRFSDTSSQLRIPPFFPPLPPCCSLRHSPFLNLWLPYSECCQLCLWGKFGPMRANGSTRKKKTTKRVCVRRPTKCSTNWAGQLRLLWFRRSKEQTLLGLSGNFKSRTMYSEGTI